MLIPQAIVQQSGGGGLTQAYIGYNTIGGSTETMTGGRAYAKSVTVAADCLLTSIEAYVKGNGSFVTNLGAGLYENNAGTPGKVLSSTQAANTDVFNPSTTARWYSNPIGVWIPAGTYWLVVKTFDGDCIIAYDSGADKIWAEGGAWFSDGSLITPSDSTRNYSIRGNTIS